MKTLVVFYSRTGHTRRVAQALAARLDADIEEIREARNPHHVLHAVRLTIEALFGRESPIRLPQKDPRSYDLVVVGTPVWAGSLPSPVRTYLAIERARLESTAFFCTHKGSGAQRVFRQMRALLTRSPLEILSVHDGEVASNGHRARVSSFVSTLKHETPLTIRLRRPTGRGRRAHVLAHPA